MQQRAMGKVLHDLVLDVHSLDWCHLLVHGGVGSCSGLHTACTERCDGAQASTRDVLNLLRTKAHACSNPRFSQGAMIVLDSRTPFGS